MHRRQLSFCLWQHRVDLPDSGDPNPSSLRPLTVGTTTCTMSTALKDDAAGWVEIGGRSQPSTEATSSLRHARLCETRRTTDMG